MAAMQQAYQIAYRKAVAALAGLDLGEVARRRGASLRARRLELVYFGQPVGIEAPSEPEAPVLFQPDELALIEKILILHYLGWSTAAGAAAVAANAAGAHAAPAPRPGRMVSFQQLAGAAFYEPAYRKRGPARIARRFGQDAAGFARACRTLGWTEERLGDAAFGGPVLPALRCVAVLHLGDEEFPAEANLLFDERIGQLLPLEDVAVLAGLVATRLGRAEKP